VDGVINVYKPEGMTSFDVVWKIRKLAHTKKVGHTGTLDPEASGVLPICIGKGTKLVDYIMDGTKEYKALLRLGIITDTYDREGKVISECPVDFQENKVVEIINSFVGNIKQIPPMYSALKINGVRLYELARKGIEVERKERDIQIFDIRIIEIELPYVTMVVKCSKGTYIRSLCYDIGEKLGCGGAMWGLERTRSGVFEGKNAVRLSDLNEENISEHVISMEKSLASFSQITFSKIYSKQLLNGIAIDPDLLEETVKDNEFYRVYLDDVGFLGIGTLEKVGFKMKKLLFQE
jgi:tRNA pseudouridine55 synthase